MYFLYILTCADNTLYTGITTDVKRRFFEHVKGSASKYTRAKKPVKIIYTEKHKNRSTASKREAEIKKMTRPQKLALAQGYSF
ncbi:MAG: GIY-YIG nuclease family protein [Patescibacteria group bacterium]